MIIPQSVITWWSRLTPQEQHDLVVKHIGPTKQTLNFSEIIGIYENESVSN